MTINGLLQETMTEAEPFDFLKYFFSLIGLFPGWLLPSRNQPPNAVSYTSLPGLKVTCLLRPGRNGKPGFSRHLHDEFDLLLIFGIWTLSTTICYPIRLRTNSYQFFFHFSR